MMKALKDKRFLLFAFLVLTGFVLKLQIAIGVPFFQDELINFAKSFNSPDNILFYTLERSFHPPLNTYLLKSFTHVFSHKEYLFRVPGLLICCGYLFFAWFCVGKFKNGWIFPIFLLLNSYLGAYSLLIANYNLAMAFLVCFFGIFHKSQTKEEYLKHFPWTYFFASAAFFTNYLAGFVAFSCLAIHAILGKEKKQLKHLLLTLTLPTLWVILRVILAKSAMGTEGGPKVEVLEPVSHLAKGTNWIKSTPYILVVMLLAFFWMEFKSKVKSAKSNSLLFTYAGTLVCFFMLIVIGSAFLKSPYYLRYLSFSLPVVGICLATLSQALSTKQASALAVLLALINLPFSPSKVSYFGIQDISKIHETIAQNGKYAGHVNFFTNNYRWWYFYEKEFQIEKHFTLKKHFPGSCNTNAELNEIYQYTQLNSYFAASLNECQNLARILDLCSKDKLAKCFDFSTPDTAIILKIFEPDRPYNREIMADLRQRFPGRFSGSGEGQ